MGQIRENLPNGDPRNKIEYLADCIDDAISGSGANEKTKRALWLDGRVHEGLYQGGAYTGDYVKRWTFDFYSQQRWMPFIYTRDAMGDVANHQINLVNQVLHFERHNDRWSAEYFYPNDYVSRLTNTDSYFYVDGQRVLGFEPIGWLFDGHKHSIELVNEHATWITSIGAGVFTGCIWNIRGYNEAGELVFYLPLDDGESEVFNDEIGGVKFTLTRNEGGQSKWIELPPHVASA